MTNSSDAPVTSLMNVGDAVAARLRTLGIARVGQLAGQDAVDLFDRIEHRTGRREDPCLLDTLLSAVDQANGETARPWWSYTEYRKQLRR